MNKATRMKRRKPMALIAVGARVFVLLLILLSLGLAVMSRTHPQIIAKLRVGADTVVAPFLILMRRPLTFLHDLQDDVESYLSVRKRNQILEDQLKDRMSLEQTMHRLKAENALLHEQLKVTDWPVQVLATGRVIGSEGGAFFRSVLIDAGQKSGARVDAAVVDRSGVVGRLVNVGRLTSRVLLMTDLNSRIPVRIERTQEQGILTGDNTDAPGIQFLPLNAGVQVGDRVTTSGYGGIFPPGLPVGTVVYKDTELVRIRPFAQLMKLNLLSIVALPTLEQIGDVLEHVNAQEESQSSVSGSAEPQTPSVDDGSLENG